MKVLGPKISRYELNITRRNCPKLTINAQSLDYWQYFVLVKFNCQFSWNFKFISKVKLKGDKCLFLGPFFTLGPPGTLDGGWLARVQKSCGIYWCKKRFLHFLSTKLKSHNIWVFPSKNRAITTTDWLMTTSPLYMEWWCERDTIYYMNYRNVFVPWKNFQNLWGNFWHFLTLLCLTSFFKEPEGKLQKNPLTFWS